HARSSRRRSLVWPGAARATPCRDASRDSRTSQARSPFTRERPSKTQRSGKAMVGYALTRIAVAVGLIWSVATLVFLVIHMVPGDPAELLLAQGGVAPDLGAVAELREKLGLDQPIHAQYLSYVAGLLKGGLGSSLLDDHSVAGEIALRLPRTLELIIAAGLIATL